MTITSFFTPIYHSNPQTIKENLENYIEGYFDLTSGPAVATMLKVASYATLIFPTILLTIKAYLRFRAPSIPINIISSNLEPGLKAIIDQAPKFNGYRIGMGTPYYRATLTGIDIRPANLFFHSLLGNQSTTLPGSGELFRFLIPHEEIRQQIMNANPQDVVAFNAEGIAGRAVNGPEAGAIPNLADLYGHATYRISYKEIQETLESQKIYTCPLLPLHFYRALKQAMHQDQIVILPGRDQAPIKLRQLHTPNCAQLINDVRNHFENYGFASQEDCERLMDLTLYELGSLVVKTEDFRIFIDPNGKILERNPNTPDAIRLINACGIRGIHATPNGPISKQTILTQTFTTALQASEKDFVVFPAVGMGVWRGDPNLYWRAFLDAVVQAGGPLEKIFVNPGHQTTQSGTYIGYSGQEFQIILNEYFATFSQNPAALTNLKKIINLYDRKTDVVHLSYQLKTAFPNAIVSLFNASDPDVTLGYHVGEYVNNLNHATTTEENYTAMGTNGLCFENITGVHLALNRLVQT